MALLLLVLLDHFIYLHELAFFFSEVCTFQANSLFGLLLNRVLWEFIFLARAMFDRRWGKGSSEDGTTGYLAVVGLTVNFNGQMLGA